MYIIKATSQKTGIVTYFSGLVTPISADKCIIRSEWTIESRFATTFLIDVLAQRVCEAFNEDGIVFTVINEKDL